MIYNKSVGKWDTSYFLPIDLYGFFLKISLRVYRELFPVDLNTRTTYNITGVMYVLMI